MSRIATIALVCLLVAGTSAAFAVTEVLKSEHAPVGAPRFDRKLAPTCDCKNDVATLTLRLREPDAVSAEVVNANGDIVRTLATDERHGKGGLVFRWDGRTDGGEVVPDGPYRLRVSLADQGRTILFPTTIHVDATAPRVELVSARPDTIAPGETRLRVVYRSSESARPLLAVSLGGKTPQVVNRGRYWPSGKAKINWSGLLDGEPAAAGRYAVTLRVQDRFGNRSEPVTTSVDVVEGTSG